MLNPKKIKEAALVLKTIAHPERLKIIEALDERKDLSVSELMEMVGLGQASLSKHLALMRARGIVESETNGNYRHYSIKNPAVVNVLNCMRKQED